MESKSFDKFMRRYTELAEAQRVKQERRNMAVAQVTHAWEAVAVALVAYVLLKVLPASVSDAIALFFIGLMAVFGCYALTLWPVSKHFDYKELDKQRVIDLMLSCFDVKMTFYNAAQGAKALCYVADRYNYACDCKYTFESNDAAHHFECSFAKLFTYSSCRDLFHGYYWTIDLHPNNDFEPCFFLAREVAAYDFLDLELIERGTPNVYALSRYARPAALPPKMWNELLAVARELGGELELVALAGQRAYVAISKADDALFIDDVLDDAKMERTAANLQLITSLPSRVKLDRIEQPFIKH